MPVTRHTRQVGTGKQITLVSTDTLNDLPDTMKMKTRGREAGGRRQPSPNTPKFERAMIIRGKGRETTEIYAYVYTGSESAKKIFTRKKQERSFRASAGKGKHKAEVKEKQGSVHADTGHENTGKGNRQRRKTLHQHSQLDDGGGVEALQRRGVGRRLEAGPGAAEGHGGDVLPRRGHVP